MALSIPEYPFWEADHPTQVFGADGSRYLQVTKSEANEICHLLPDEARAADELFSTGALRGSGLGRGLNPALTPQGVRGTIQALLASFAPSHEVKCATVAVALHRWFDQPLDEETPA